ncbi:MAG: FKBP-type peptidyl-prolyl cis-trans isomerase [Crocinitomicaceae bacterium]|nr:FKBP-type peptidyl-prolyl cis-trans isomerase [Crocinitomicaceae bacterium]
MKNSLIYILPLVILMACGGKSKEEVVSFESEKQKLSYALGADFAMPIVNAGEQASSILDFEAVAKGFELALNDADYASCEEVVIDAFGTTFSTPDSTKKIPGSECFGKMNGSRMYQMLKELNRIDKFDMKYLAYGYHDALMKRDTILDKGERASLLTAFQTEIQTEQANKTKELEKPFFEKAKALSNSKVIDGGIVIETIQEGKGASPNMTDEVTAHYILTNAVGDTLESSFDRGQPLSISLQSVIPGWTMSFPQLKKGGKYRLYIPADLAYGASKGALCFYVELVDFKSVK